MVLRLRDHQIWAHLHPISREPPHVPNVTVSWAVPGDHGRRKCHQLAGKDLLPTLNMHKRPEVVQHIIVSRNLVHIPRSGRRIVHIKIDFLFGHVPSTGLRFDVNAPSADSARRSILSDALRQFHGGIETPHGQTFLQGRGEASHAPRREVGSARKVQILAQPQRSMAKPKSRPALKNQAGQPATALKDVQQLVMQEFLLDNRPHSRKGGIFVQHHVCQCPK